MYSIKQKKFHVKKMLLFLPVLLILPFVIAFDSILYLLTRPSCLTCGNLLEFLKSASLTVFLLTGVGYQLKGKKENG